MANLILLRDFQATQIELWVPTSYYGYEVSNLGRIRSLRRRGNKNTKLRAVPVVRKLQYNRAGYAYIVIYVDRKAVSLRSHQLVAEAFVPNPLGLKYVNHLTGMKSNCCADNLEWTTSSDNQRHAYKYGLRSRLFGEANGRTKLSAEQHEEVKVLRGQGMKLQDIAERFNITDGRVARICLYE